MKRIIPLFLLITALALGSVPASGASVQDIFKAAQKLQKEKKYDQAITEYKKLVDLLVKGGNKPVAQQVQMNVGVLHFRQGRYQEAVKAYGSALKLNPKPKPELKLKLLRNLASALHKSGDYSSAAGLREKILADKNLSPKLKPVLWMELAASYRAGEIHTRAVEAYGQALSLLPPEGQDEKRVLLLTSLGYSLSKLGRSQEAINNLKQALDLARKSNLPKTVAESLSNLGVVYWDLGHYTAALKHLDQALEIEKQAKLQENLGADLNNRGLVLKSSGNLPGALGAIEEALGIAQEINQPRDQAIALSNRALLRRILGQNQEARRDYLAALKIYEQESFEEGRASCYLGLGKLLEVVDQDYKAAHGYYLKAIDIYKRLGNMGYQAEALNQLGRVLKFGINPTRTTRDLLFAEQEPELIEVPPQKAAKDSTRAFTEALRLGRITGRREVVWSALQGLGFALKEQGRLKESLGRYQEAVKTVVEIRFGGSDSELMSDYLKDKEDLFCEAMEVCSGLHAQTKDPKYLRLQMEFQEIYKNEVMKGAVAASGPDFEDSEKADLFNKMTGASAKKKKLEETQGRLNQSLEQEKAAGEKDPQAGKRRVQLEKESEAVKAELRKLDRKYKELLAQWKKKYPSDASLFDSAAKVDLNEIQAGLAQDEALLQYFPLSDALSIICVTREEISAATVPVPYAELSQLIRDGFVYRHIEEYGHMEDFTPANEKKNYSSCLKVLHQLHDVLIKPVAKPIAEKQRLLIITSKYLSYVPFAALVQSLDQQGQPRFLVRDKTVSYLRLSFFDNYLKAKKSTPILDQAKLLVVGNPDHNKLRSGLTSLDGAEKEARTVCDVASQKENAEHTLMITGQATEDAWRESIAQNGYSVFYFATHGVPYAEALQTQRVIEKKIAGYKVKRDEAAQNNDAANVDKYEKYIAKYQPFVDFCRSTFTSKSPLNGFLYMAYTGNEKHDGVLTLKEILEMPDPVFSQARLAVLSACNTAVTYSPKIKKELRAELESQEVSADLTASGWTPGVDQISLTDTFMKRNFTSVLGTLWFADDEAAGYISSNFFKGLTQYSPSESLRQAQLSYLDQNPLPKGYTAVYKHPYYWAVAAAFGE